MAKTRTTLLFAIVIAGAVAGQSLAQKKLYRWVDKEGKVHISDQLPPEAVDQARTEFNATTGSSTGAVSRQLTTEERAQQQAEMAAAAKSAADAQTLKRLEEGMLVNYETEDQLRRAYNERINLINQTVEATEISIRSQKTTLASLLNDAAEAELSKRTVSTERANTIRQMHTEIVNQQGLQIKQQASRAAIDQEFEKVLARYRELRGTTPAAAPTATTVPAAAPTMTAPSRK